MIDKIIRGMTVHALCKWRLDYANGIKGKVTTTKGIKKIEDKKGHDLHFFILFLHIYKSIFSFNSNFNIGVFASKILPFFSLSQAFKVID